MLLQAAEACTAAARLRVWTQKTERRKQGLESAGQHSDEQSLHSSTKVQMSANKEAPCGTAGAADLQQDRSAC